MDAVVGCELCESKGRARELIKSGAVGIQDFTEVMTNIFGNASKIRSIDFVLDIKTPKLITCGKRARVVRMI